MGQQGAAVRFDGERWTPFETKSGNILYSVYETRNESSLWALGVAGWVFHGRDEKTLSMEIVPISKEYIDGLLSMYATNDASSVWIVGSNKTVLRGTPAGYFPFISEARIVRGGLQSQLESRTICSDSSGPAPTVSVSIQTEREFRRRLQPTKLPEVAFDPKTCTITPVKFNPGDLDIQSG